MIMSEENRTTLFATLHRLIPEMADSQMRSVFKVMLALLCDYQELALARRADAEKYLSQIQGIEARLQQVLKKAGRFKPAGRESGRN